MNDHGPYNHPQSHDLTLRGELDGLLAANQRPKYLKFHHFKLEKYYPFTIYMIPYIQKYKLAENLELFACLKKISYDFNLS